jgi:branched-subunit amino acid aminotransferase/4-amino-4-deoxychorismate lyase
VPDLHTLDGVEVDGVPAEFALYPFGVFTTFVLVAGRVLGWDAHVTRLAHDAKALWGHDLDRERLASAVRSHSALVDGPRSVRVTLYPEALTIAAPARARGCRMLVSSGPAHFPVEPERTFGVRSVEYAREHAELKSTALFTQIRLRREAQLAGFDDVLFRWGAEVREGATWTVLAWLDGEAITPRDAVLHSITADHLACVAEGMGWRFARRALLLDELTRANLVLAVNVNSPARAISRVDDVDLAVDEDLLEEVARAYAVLPLDSIHDSVLGRARAGTSTAGDGLSSET